MAGHVQRVALRNEFPFSRRYLRELLFQPAKQRRDVDTVRICGPRLVNVVLRSRFAMLCSTVLVVFSKIMENHYRCMLRFASVKFCILNCRYVVVLSNALRILYIPGLTVVIRVSFSRAHLCPGRMNERFIVSVNPL